VALHHRERTGEGQFVDVSAVETMSTLIGDSLFAANLTGEVPRPDGNFHPELAPHGAYPCQDGGWIAIACGSDEEFHALAAGLGAPELANDPRFARCDRRVANHHALDDVLGTLTFVHDADALGETLRATGVAAYPSASSMALVSDSSLWEREAFRMVRNGNGDSRPVVGPSWRMTPDDAAIEHGAPLLGEHNDYVYREMLGLSREELGGLVARGVVD